MAEIRQFVPEYDVEKARHMLSYLVRAHERVSERTLARERLKAQLLAIRKFGPAKLKEQLDMLEAAISSALEKESILKANHKQEDFLHGQLRQRLKQLECRMDDVLGDEEERRKRIKGLEAEIRGVVGLRLTKIQRLRDQIGRLERMHHQLRGQGADEDRMQTLELKLRELKERLEDLSHADEA